MIKCALTILFTAVLSFASWNDVTDELQLPHVVITTQGNRTTLMELSAGKAYTLKLPKKTSTRLTMTTETKGALTFNKGKMLISTKILAKGENEIKMFLEAGEYQIKSSVGAKGKIYFWKKRNLQSRLPDGGGYAVYLVKGDQKLAYYRCTPDIVPQLSIKGPERACVFFRADIPLMANNSKVEIYVKERDTVISHKISDLTKSNETSIFEDSSHGISEAVIIEFKVPAGLHQYTVHVKGCSGLVRFYEKGKKKSKNNSDNDQGFEFNIENAVQVAKAGENDADPISQYQIEQPSEVQIQLPVPEKKHHNKKNKSHLLRLFVKAGAGYDNNVYKYSSGFTDTYNLGEKVYRYPGVNNVQDLFVPVDAQFGIKLRKWFLKTSISDNFYTRNVQMNDFSWNTLIGWSGPLQFRLQYSLAPHHPVRPTYDNDYVTYQRPSYSMMWYRQDKAGLTIGWNKGKIRPYIDWAFGYNDYVYIFNNYDASVMEGGVGVTLSTKIKLDLHGEIGQLTAPHNTGEDQTNAYWNSDVDLHTTFHRFTPGLKGSIMQRIYSVSDTGDSHCKRKDLSGTFDGYMKYDINNFEVMLNAGYDWRETSSPRLFINNEKDYRSFSTALTIGYELKI